MRTRIFLIPIFRWRAAKVRMLADVVRRTADAEPERMGSREGAPSGIEADARASFRIDHLDGSVKRDW